MSKVFFSVIIPVYNVEKYLSDCLESVLAQHFKDYEIILVDDGSSDNSGGICQEYKNRFPDTITVIHKQNGGLISARREGLAMSHGEYICFVDSDDMIRPDMLGSIAKLIQENKADIVSFKWKKIDMAGNPLDEKVQSVFPEGPVIKQEFFRKIISTTGLNSLCLKAVKRSLFDIDTDYSALFSVQNGEDLLQTLPLVCNANSFYYSEEQFYLYRMNATSLTHTYRKKQFRNLDIIRPKVYQYMVKMRMDSEENKMLFYQKYANSLWQALFLYALSEEKDLKEDMQEIIEYEFVQKLQSYLSKIQLPFYKSFGLQLFYKRKWKCLVVYCKILQSVYELRRELKK